MVFFPCWYFTYFPCGCITWSSFLLVLHIFSLLAHHMVFFPCGRITFFPCGRITWSSFPAGASHSFPAGISHGLLSLLVLHILSLLVHHMVFFPCWCFTFFPVGTSHGLLSLLVHHMVLFPCWCFTSNLLALLVFHKFPTLKFCHNNQTKWSPLIDIHVSQALTPSLPGDIFLSYATLQKIAIKSCKQDISKTLFELLF